jgi:hypothetical protein
MLPSQHHASFLTALKPFIVSLFTHPTPLHHKINPLDYAMSHFYFCKGGLISEESSSAVAVKEAS